MYQEHELNKITRVKKKLALISKQLSLDLRCRVNNMQLLASEINFCLFLSFLFLLFRSVFVLLLSFFFFFAFFLYFI